MSIEETNRLRAKLGLKPLQVDNDADKKDDENKEVFVKTENISEKKEAEAFREKLRTMRKKQEIKQKYEKVRCFCLVHFADSVECTFCVV